jgi:hypothetical protein
LALGTFALLYQDLAPLPIDGEEPAELAVSDISVKVGETATVKATGGVKPYTFESSDPEIAEIDETTGEITGIAEGEVTITVTDSDGASVTATATIVSAGEAVWSLKGDADVDGDVDLDDLAIILEQCICTLVMDPDVPLEEGTEAYLNADVNEDDIVDLKDLGAELEYCIGIIVMDPDNSWAAATGKDDLVRLQPGQK